MTSPHQDRPADPSAQATQGTQATRDSEARAAEEPGTPAAAERTPAPATVSRAGGATHASADGSGSGSGTGADGGSAGTGGTSAGNGPSAPGGGASSGGDGKNGTTGGNAGNAGNGGSQGSGGNNPAPAPKYADRAYRSSAGITGGIVLLALAGWLGGDAVARGDGRTPWLALAAMLLALPLVVAFTLRPAVFAGEERVRIRNPFRTITIPWAGVDRLRASYSTELFAGDRKYQLWAIPVSLRARKRAARQTARAQAAGDDVYASAGRPSRGAGPWSVGGGAGRRGAGRASGEPVRAWADQALEDLRELADRHGAPAEGEPRPEPEVRWAYEVIAPAVAGAVVLAILLAV